MSWRALRHVSVLPALINTAEHHGKCGVTGTRENRRVTMVPVICTCYFRYSQSTLCYIRIISLLLHLLFFFFWILNSCFSRKWFDHSFYKPALSEQKSICVLPSTWNVINSVQINLQLMSEAIIHDNVCLNFPMDKTTVLVLNNHPKSKWITSVALMKSFNVLIHALSRSFLNCKRISFFSTPDGQSKLKHKQTNGKKTTKYWFEFQIKIWTFSESNLCES